MAMAWSRQILVLFACMVHGWCFIPSDSTARQAAMDRSSLLCGMDWLLELDEPWPAIEPMVKRIAARLDPSIPLPTLMRLRIHLRQVQTRTLTQRCAL